MRQASPIWPALPAHRLHEGTPTPPSPRACRCSFASSSLASAALTSGGRKRTPFFTLFTCVPKAGSKGTQGGRRFQAMGGTGPTALGWSGMG